MSERCGEEGNIHLRQGIDMMALATHDLVVNSALHLMSYLSMNLVQL